MFVMFPLTTLILSLHEDSDAIQDCISTSQTCEEEECLSYSKLTINVHKSTSVTALDTEFCWLSDAPKLYIRDIGCLVLSHLFIISFVSLYS
jgi:hypothetical protein